MVSSERREDVGEGSSSNPSGKRRQPRVDDGGSDADDGAPVDDTDREVPEIIQSK